jgi:hypothetical protein
MRARQYDPLVEYYRRRLHCLESIPLDLPGFGSRWRLYRNELGASYQQDDTGFVLPAGLVNLYMESQP